jgi:hypothetical protein
LKIVEKCLQAPYLLVSVRLLALIDIGRFSPDVYPMCTRKDQLDIKRYRTDLSTAQEPARRSAGRTE